MTAPAYVVMPVNPADQRWLNYDDRGAMASGYPYLTDQQSQARLYRSYEVAERAADIKAYGINLPPLCVVAIDLTPRPLEQF